MLLALPAELLHQIASCLVQSDSGLTSFASSCRAVRLSARSLLFRSMTVSSATRLESLSSADLTTLGHFTLRLEYDFFEALAAACNPTAFPQCVAARHGSVLPALAHILLSAPQLSSLRVQIPENVDDCRASAWTQLLRMTTQGITLGPALANVLPKRTTFPALRALHLDGISHLAPLVRMTPKLTALSARMCEGFSEDSCRELVDRALPLLPHLEELAFDPFSLHFVGSELNIPKAIMAAVPGLQILDLRSRAFDYSAGCTEWRTTDKIDPLDCVPTGSRLRELYLPFAPSSNEGTTPIPTEPHKADLANDRTRETEVLAVVQLASASPLAKVSWLRSDGDEPIEYSIERDEQGIPTEINVVGRSPTQSDPVMWSPESGNAAGLASNFASMIASIASSTTFHAAVVMWLLADTAALPLTVPSSFATPALLATSVALGIASRARTL